MQAALPVAQEFDLRHALGQVLLGRAPLRRQVIAQEVAHALAKALFVGAENQVHTDCCAGYCRADSSRCGSLEYV